VVVLALGTALLWGLADFGGGLLARRLPTLTVVVAAQSAALLVLGAAVAATGAWRAADGRLLHAVAAGLVGTVALLAFYRALALGPMGVVSPLGSLGVAVPVTVGLLLGERPGALQFAGIAVAVIGVVLAGGPELRGTPVQRRAVVLTLTAAAGFGATMALIAEVSTTAPGLLLALFVQRLTNVATGGAVLWRSVRRGTPALPPGTDLSALRPLLPALVFIGLADVAANGLYALAARTGPVTAAAVLASLYPVVTVLAALLVLRERVRAVQAAGAGLALAGSALLAAG
jgi:drug/metabolite transporter (DMT)-like permease